MPARRGPRDSGKSGVRGHSAKKTPTKNVKTQGLKVVHFAKDEIVWAKMRFFPPWPA